MMAKSGLFAGKITKEAPADKALTDKQKGYQWMEWGNFAATGVWILTRGENDWDYLHVNYLEGTATRLATMPHTWTSATAGFAVDSGHEYVIFPATEFNALDVYKWDAGMFAKVGHLEPAHTDNNTFYFFGGDGYWMKGASDGSLITGLWDDDSIGFGDKTELVVSTSSYQNTLDFVVGRFTGYGEDYFVITPATGPGSGALALIAWKEKDDPFTVLDTQTSEEGQAWGWDRHTGDIVFSFAGTGFDTHVEWYKYDMKESLSKVGDIELGYETQCATMYDFTLYVAFQLEIRAYALDGLIPTLIDTFDLSVAFSSSARIIHTDPYSNHLYFVEQGGERCVCIDVLPDGTFGTNYIDLTPASENYSYDRAANAMRFLPASLKE